MTEFDTMLYRGPSDVIHGLPRLADTLQSDMNYMWQSDPSYRGLEVLTSVIHSDMVKL